MKSTETCLTCKNYNRCNHPDKSFGFRCIDFKNLDGLTSEAVLDGLAESLLGTGNAPTSSVGNDLLLDLTGVEEKAKETELIDYLDSVLEDPNPIPKDLKFDDSDFPEFDNFYEWCMSPYGAATPPFAKQLAIGVHLFAEYCPHPTCTHPRFQDIRTIPYRVSPEQIAGSVTFLVKGVCPKCGARKSQLIAEDKLALYDEFAGCIGQRGGKSAMFSLFAPYIIHKYLKLQNPNKFFGLMQNTVLSGTFVGLTFSRAMSLLWTPILNLMTTSKWFEEYHAHMNALGQRYGVTPLVIKDTFVDYRHRRIRLYPSGPNKRTLRGDSRIVSGIDEAGWFHSGGDDDEERERASGKEVHGALDRSLKTVRMATKKRILEDGYDNLITAYNMSISSPSHPTDLIMYLTTLYEGSRDCLAARIPTWEFNPLYSSREDFKKEYAENYARAERDFGANPMVNENRAYSEEEVKAVVARCVGTNLLETESKIVVGAQGEKAMLTPKIRRMIPNAYPSVLSLDAGETNNSFALTLIQRKASGNVGVTGIIEIMPPANGTAVINFNKMYENIIKPILETYNVCGVITDRWQSTAILHRIVDEFGIYVKTLSAKPAHFTAFDSYHRPDPLITYPKPEISIEQILSPTSSDSYRVVYANKPVAHFFHQLNTIQDINGVYDKGVGNTDDLVRTAVLGVNLINDPAFASKYLVERAPKVQVSLGAVGAMSGASQQGLSHNGSIPGIGASSFGGAVNAPQTGNGLVVGRTGYRS